MRNERLDVPSDLPLYPIRTVAKLTGLNPGRIRAWEREYHLLEPARTEGRQRLFSNGDVSRIRWIKKMMREHGMSLKGIQRLIEARKEEPAHR